VHWFCNGFARLDFSSARGSESVCGSICNRNHNWARWNGILDRFFKAVEAHVQVSTGCCNHRHAGINRVGLHRSLCFARRRIVHNLRHYPVSGLYLVHIELYSLCQASNTQDLWLWLDSTPLNVNVLVLICSSRSSRANNIYNFDDLDLCMQCMLTVSMSWHNILVSWLTHWICPLGSVFLRDNAVVSQHCRHPP